MSAPIEHSIIKKSLKATFNTVRVGQLIEYSGLTKLDRLTIR